MVFGAACRRFVAPRVVSADLGMSLNCPHGCGSGCGLRMQSMWVDFRAGVCSGTCSCDYCHTAVWRVPGLGVAIDVVAPVWHLDLSGGCFMVAGARLAAYMGLFLNCLPLGGKVGH